MSTEARRKANAAYHAKREAAGLKKVTLWLSPEARFKLDALKKAAGSKDKAAELAILAWRGLAPEIPQEPPVARKSASMPQSATKTKPRPVVNRLKGQWKAP